MARRYCGNVLVTVEYTDGGYYRCGVAGRTITVNPPAAGYGPDVAYDSPAAYDQVARAAVAFAMDEDDERPELDTVEWDPIGTGAIIRRKK